MKRNDKTLFLVVGFFFVFQACAAQQLEVNPGFDKNTTLGEQAPSILGEGPEAPKPTWEIGYTWEYEWERPDSSGTFIQRIIGEEVFEGNPCFVLESAGSEIFYTKNMLGEIGTKIRGRVVKRRDVPILFLAWPLRAGREWNNVYTVEDLRQETAFKADFRFMVSKIEEITVPAGKFTTYKIEQYFSFSGKLLQEFWYSPKVKWIVKRIKYVDEAGLRTPHEFRLKYYAFHVYPEKEII